MNGGSPTQSDDRVLILSLDLTLKFMFELLLFVICQTGTFFFFFFFSQHNPELLVLMFNFLTHIPLYFVFFADCFVYDD